ncbi:YiiX/YebB-like N1pC/P60 family cysteine hydrolase [Hymenobacter nivis]|uniref:Uncharacterized protein n=1 Tax=Hymenobacter nivis TaxID=1850093 RepID=A0A2Z3GSP4_9BACT|nr:YiiX/YebB-like N1pC/P60 family cysteine hydrolase [Hymenobacter nivis]AWM35092.1 hypothetical protein DDQ68_21370 [Hymenobacter nivis]
MGKPAPGPWSLHCQLRRSQSHQAAETTAAALGAQLRDGNLIFHTSQSAQSQAIQRATHSPYSHCGIVYKNAGQWQVFEAVQPAKLTPLADRWSLTPGPSPEERGANRQLKANYLNI